MFPPKTVLPSGNVIEVDPNRVTQVKTLDADGYAAIQVTSSAKKSSRIKAEAGHFAKAGVGAGLGFGNSVSTQTLLKRGRRCRSGLFADGQKVT